MDFDRILMDLPNKEQKQEWYLTLNPYGKVPVLVEEGAWVYESAICDEYLEEKYPTPALSSADPAAKARMRMWVDFCNNQFIPPLITIAYELRKPAAEQDAEKIRANKEKLNREQFPRLEEALKGKDYLMGNYSIADITFTPFLAICERVGVDMSGFPATKAWTERLKAKPSYEEVKIGMAA